MRVAVSYAGEPGQSGRWYFDHGVRAYESKNYPTAVDHFLQAKELDPSLAAEVHLYMGRLLIKAQRWDEAVGEILKAQELGLSPENEEVAKVVLAYIHAYGDIPIVEAKAPPREARRETPPEQKPWTLRFSLSEEYVDGIAPPLTPGNSLNPLRQDDFRTRINFGGDYRFDFGDKGKLTTGYDFTQSLYADFDEYNLQGHTVGGRYSFQASPKVSLSLNYNFDYFTLDGDDYLFSHRTGARAFFQEWESFYGRIGYQFKNDEFELNPTQDRDVHSVDLTEYWFFNKNRDFISVGYTYGNADANLSRWSYDLHRVAATAKYDVLPRHRLTGLLAYSSYEYDGFDTLETTKIRDDDVLSFRARYTYELSDWADLFVQYAITDTDSNILRQDYLGEVVSLGTALTW